MILQLVSASLGLLLGSPVTAMSLTEPQAILVCNFDSTEVDQLVGEGGASAGEPTSRGGVAATVRSQPFPTQCLEIKDDWGAGARAVKFEFLDGFVAYEDLECRFNLYFDNLDAYDVYILGPLGATTVSLLHFVFTSDGTILARDLNDPVDAPVGSYVSGEILAFKVTFETGFVSSGHEHIWYVDVSIGEAAVIEHAYMGQYSSPYPGIGAVLFGLGDDPDSEGTFFLDDLLVLYVPDGVPVTRATWGAVKARY